MEEALPSELRSIFETVFGRPLPLLDRTTRASQVDGWNSLRHANLRLALEDHYGIEIPDEQYADVRHVGDISDLVAALVAAER